MGLLAVFIFDKASFFATSMKIQVAVRSFVELHHGIYPTTISTTLHVLFP
jgi:hypothetical protein